MGNHGGMSQQPQHRSRHEDDATAQPEEPEQPPAEALEGYPPEASPQPDDNTEPLQVVGEQTDPGRRLEVFPEDEEATERRD